MSDTISDLDDDAAEHILNVIAESRAHVGVEKIPWNPDLRQALAREFQVAP